MSRELGIVEDTLYVPMLGRIYASENCRNILYDEKALELKTKLPEGLIENDTQTQYTYLASAARSANMDRYIAAFLRRKPDGIIVQLGGFEELWLLDLNREAMEAVAAGMYYAEIKRCDFLINQGIMPLCLHNTELGIRVNNLPCPVHYTEM